MSKVSFSPIQPGDAASIIAPNATMTSTATATAAVNAENVRQEGIDERNLSFPLISTNSHNSGDWVRKLYTLNNWDQVPVGGSWAGGTGASPSFAAGAPFTVSIGSSFSYAIIRYSFEIRIEGRTSGAANFVNDDLGFAIFSNGTLLSHTERHIQNEVALSVARANSEAARSVESVSLLHYVPVPGTYTFDLRYFNNTHGSSALGADSAYLGWVLNNADAVTISRLTASVISYK